MNLANLFYKIGAIVLLMVASSTNLHAQSQIFLHSNDGGVGFGHVLGIDGSPILDENPTSDFTLIIMGGVSSDSGTWTTIVNTPANFYSDAPGCFDLGPASVSGTGGQNFYYQVYVYDNRTGSSYANATTKGSSGVYSVLLTTAPTNPPNLNNFLDFQLAAVPEPTTLALAGMGGVAMLLRRRKKLAA